MSKESSKLNQIITDRSKKNGDKHLSLRETEYLFAKYLRATNRNMSYEEAQRIAKITAFRYQTRRDINEIAKQTKADIDRKLALSKLF